MSNEQPVRGPRQPPLMTVTPHLIVRDSCQPPQG
jgi:hypothetical protein